jgi:hypothetical protein
MKDQICLWSVPVSLLFVFYSLRNEHYLHMCIFLFLANIK